MSGVGLLTREQLCCIKPATYLIMKPWTNLSIEPSTTSLTLSQRFSMKYVNSTLAILVLVFTAIFALQNTGQMDVSLLLWSFSAPKVLVILGTFMLGMVSGWGILELIKKALYQPKAN